MSKRKVSLCALCCLISAITARSVAAETITVTSGYLLMNGSSGDVQLIGDQGFSLGAGLSADAGFFVPIKCFQSYDCVAGSDVSLQARWFGNDLGGELSFRGETHTDLGAPNSLAQAGVDFSGSFTTPPAAPTAVVTSPFQFTGFFSVPNADPQNPILTFDLAGAGIATITLTLNPSSPPDNPAWSVNTVRYDFSAADPVPEPGTMLLVGLGIAGVARRLRQNRHRPGANARGH